MLALSMGPSTRRNSSLGAMPPSCPRVPDTSRADDSGNEDDVEDEGPVLEVTPTQNDSNGQSISGANSKSRGKKLMSYLKLRYEKVLDHKSGK